MQLLAHAVLRLGVGCHYNIWIQWHVSTHPIKPLHNVEQLLIIANKMGENGEVW
jgi:hypothetical protein